MSELVGNKVLSNIDSILAVALTDTAHQVLTEKCNRICRRISWITAGRWCSLAVAVGSVATIAFGLSPYSAATGFISALFAECWCVKKLMQSKEELSDLHRIAVRVNNYATFLNAA